MLFYFFLPKDNGSICSDSSDEGESIVIKHFHYLGKCGNYNLAARRVSIFSCYDDEHPRLRRE